VEPVEWTKPDDLPCYGYPLPKTPDLPKVPRLTVGDNFGPQTMKVLYPSGIPKPRPLSKGK
jgi:hypothetical protein